MIRKVLPLFFAALLMTFSSQAMAGGSQSYPNGAEAFMAGAVPPPGFYFLDYMYYYNADTMKDDNGDDIAAFDDVSVVANVFRVHPTKAYFVSWRAIIFNLKNSISL